MFPIDTTELDEENHNAIKDTDELIGNPSED